MAKTKLTVEQNLSLKGLNLEQKLEKLRTWRKNQEVSREAFEHFSNLWINRESKKLQGDNRTLRRSPRENFIRCRTVIEGQLEELINRLRSNLNRYIADRSEAAISIKESDYAEFERLVRKYFTLYPSKISRLLALGLRYPDSTRRLNKFCFEWIKYIECLNIEGRRGWINKSLHHLKDYYNDSLFWTLLWEDDFVPMDAIRLMIIKGQGQKEEYQMDPRFDKYFLRDLLPLIEAQRDKEIERLKWAQTRDDRDEQNQVPRKIRRLEAFNTLVECIIHYIN